MSYIFEYEKNAASVVTNATGAGTVTLSKLSQVVTAELSSAGYVIVASDPVGQNVPFQVYQDAGTAGALAKPTAAVTFDPGAIRIKEWGR